MLKKVNIAGSAVLVILWLSGCRATELAEGGIFSNQAADQNYGKPRLVDYALARNGAKIKCSKASRHHPPDSVINGITDSEAWDLPSALLEVEKLNFVVEYRYDNSTYLFD